MADPRVPPAWATDASERLDLDGFAKYFTQLFSACTSTFEKLESWQTYLQPDSGALKAFLAGAPGDEVARSLAAEAEAEAFVYEKVRSTELRFERLRVIERPYSAYVAFEMINYDVRVPLGEEVRIADAKELDADVFDFLLFDRRHALIHDYGLNGLQVGGWYTSDTMTLNRLSDAYESVRRHSVSYRPKA